METYALPSPLLAAARHKRRQQQIHAQTSADASWPTSPAVIVARAPPPPQPPQPPLASASPFPSPSPSPLPSASASASEVARARPPEDARRHVYSVVSAIRRLTVPRAVRKPQCEFLLPIPFEQTGAVTITDMQLHDAMMTAASMPACADMERLQRSVDSIFLRFRNPMSPYAVVEEARNLRRTYGITDERASIADDVYCFSSDLPPDRVAFRLVHSAVFCDRDADRARREMVFAIFIVENVYKIAKFCTMSLFNRVDINKLAEHRPLAGPGSAPAYSICVDHAACSYE